MNKDQLRKKYGDALAKEKQLDERFAKQKKEMQETNKKLQAARAEVKKIEATAETLEIALIEEEVDDDGDSGT